MILGSYAGEKALQVRAKFLSFQMKIGLTEVAADLAIFFALEILRSKLEMVLPRR
jgi:hypothetical protein